MRPSPCLAVLALFAAGCSHESVSIRGTFRDAAASADSTLTVWAVEAQREVPVQAGEFRMDDLAPGPVTLEMRVGGRAVGRVEVPDLPVGATLTLQGLRVDRASGRAFPADVKLTGAKMVTVNGVRVGPNDDLPGDVDAAGTVMALSEDHDALLVRPLDAAMPDLRVVLVPTTHAATREGAAADVEALARGDTVRVKGATRAGYVIATGVELPASRAVPATSAATIPDAPEDEADAGDSDPPAARASPVPAAAAAPARGPGRGKARGHGKKHGWF
ncbi:MAG TPA: hypothetical protein VFH27_16460 [Longimicrobiaceae bacterium]|nr:hypothetical protein [Longimicrobiaceae bacterium]